MSTDIRVKTSFFRHRKTKRLRRICGYEGVVALLILWSYAADHKSTGLLTGMDADDIEESAEWDGERGTFFNAITDAKINFLERREDDYYLHDWHDHQGWVVNAKSRSEAGKKAAAARWNKKYSGDSENSEKADAGESHTNGIEKNTIGIEKNTIGIEKNAKRNATSQKADAPIPTPIPTPTPIPKENTASGDAVSSQNGEKIKSGTNRLKQPQPSNSEEKTYKTGSRRILKGKKLRWFNEFWDAFNLKSGKAEAADSWLDIEGLDESLAKTIIEAAKRECGARKNLPKGLTPKWSQGWLSKKRWEDEQTEHGMEPHQPRKKSVDQVLEERRMAD